MNKHIIAAITFLVSAHLTAQESWPLKRCIEYGFKNNRNNTIYANDKLAADAKAKEALSAYLPKISLTSTLDNNLKLQESVIPAGVFGEKPMRIAFSQKFNANATAQLDQTLYDQALITGLKANKYSKQKADLNTQQNQEALIYNVTTAYFEISVYRQQLDFLQSNMETYSRQIQIFELQVSKGITLQKDLDKVRVDFNNTRSQIRVAQSNLQLAENELKFEMGYPIEQVLVVNSITRQAAPSALLADQSANFEVASRTDYKISEVNIKMLEIEQNRIQAEGLPKLTAYARYGAVGFGDNLTNAYSEVSDFAAIGLKLNIPILDFYKRNAQYTQAKIEHINAEEQLKIDESRYKVDHQNALTKVMQEQANVDNNQRNVALAESVLKTTNLQLQKGVTDLTDWLNTQNSLKEAQNSYLKSLYSFFLAKIDLEKASGTLQFFYNSL
ncbi:transporter [Flavobacterium aquidurense]|uniref:TolC family protein n=1 Tax=Flavobacterium aquidurense TaxID=362413 RepID=UPI00091D20FB|nr:TolC family protein [Flavobacterium aquidurense]OXA70465.1 transporter [Flavobacterium aquidurense]SHH72971.1 Outer membrane protein TolC [Flavobacterium frigidimaris]